jgi:ribosomal protein L29
MFGKRSAQEKSIATELETAKMEAMKARFRKVLGESVSSHVVQGIRRKIAECTRALRIGKGAECSEKTGCVKNKKKKCNSVRGKNA